MHLAYSEFQQFIVMINTIQIRTYYHSRYHSKFNRRAVRSRALPALPVAKFGTTRPQIRRPNSPSSLSSSVTQTVPGRLPWETVESEVMFVVLSKCVQTHVLCLV
ncbi:hypothetical protein LSTR_LSTR010625 [Laodelphax striatellus]|uniref:Uncharacterized protein n=1 Tax=Laodelphax striatellus TaxID=195883 RepID=A0A482X441_LAOST|nr:hypothetical protein LSTR_LSTR010625 [Laodelphax striatellus]